MISVKLLNLAINDWLAHTDDDMHPRSGRQVDASTTKEGMRLRSGRQVGASTTKEGMRLRSGREVGKPKIVFADLEKRVWYLTDLLEHVTSEVQRCGCVPRYTLLGAINFLRYHCIDLLAQLPRFSDAVLRIISDYVNVVNHMVYEGHWYPEYMKKRINTSYGILERKTWRMERRCDYVPRTA